jgi:ribosomal protein L11 methyltransferase
MINWQEIWKTHSPYYKNGKFILELPNGEKVFFEPAAAFGDGSHPTTNLILDHLPDLVRGKTVVDVGSGSGVLSLAASKLGANEVFGLEIDFFSISAMRVNIDLNGITNVHINKKPEEFDMVLINMISSEQRIALGAYPYLLKGGVDFLISGILNGEREETLKMLNPSKVYKTATSGDWTFIHCQI